MLLIITLLVGILAGLIMGMLGGGSGLVLVPGISIILAYYYPIPSAMVMQFAIGTTLAVTFFFVLFTVYSQHRRGAILWHLFNKLFISMGIGTIIGNTFAHKIPSGILKIAFGIVVLLLAIRFISSDDKKLKPKPWPKPLAVFTAGGFFGLVAGALGIAPFVVPYLKKYGVSMHQAIATSTACGLLFAFVGGATAMIVGWDATTQIQYALGYVYLPVFIPLFLGCLIFAEVGVRLAHKMSASLLKKIYCVLLFAVALKMLF